MKKILLAFLIVMFLSSPVFAQRVYIGDLTEDTAPTSDDLIETENDPSGSPSSKKVTLGNLSKGFTAVDPDSLSGDTTDDNLIDPAIGGAGADTSGMTGKPYLTSGVVSVGTQTQSFVINEPTASDDFLLFRTPYAITITAIHGVLLTGTNVIGGIDECDTNGANCVAVDSDITFDGSLDSDDGALTNGAIDAGDWIRWHTTSVDAPGYLTVTIYYQ